MSSCTGAPRRSPRSATSFWWQISLATIKAAAGAGRGSRRTLAGCCRVRSVRSPRWRRSAASTGSTSRASAPWAGAGVARPSST
eukprot:6586213-Prymnesium_polylepis.1